MLVYVKTLELFFADFRLFSFYSYRRNLEGMQSKSENGNRLEPDSHAIPPTSVYPEPWYHAMTRGNISNSSSFECPNGGSESNDGQSYSNGRLNGEDDDGAKESQNTASSRSGA